MTSLPTSFPHSNCNYKRFFYNIAAPVTATPTPVLSIPTSVTTTPIPVPTTPTGRWVGGWVGGKTFPQLFMVKYGFQAVHFDLHSFQSKTYCKQILSKFF